MAPQPQGSLQSASQSLGRAVPTSTSFAPAVATRLTSRAAKSKTQVDLACSVPGCKHEGVFTRQYELDRHVTTKHSDHKPYHCGAINCFNKTLPWTFSRSDKLADHIRAKHHREVLFADCPADSCNIGPRTLEALAVHIRIAHPALQGEARAILSVALGKKRKCPWWQCAKQISSDAFMAHLGSHDPDEILAAQSSLYFESLALTNGAANVAGQGRQRPAIEVVCPVCQTGSPSFEQFIEHLWTRHLFLDSTNGIDHFLQWKGILSHHVRQTSRANIIALLPWTVLTTREHYRDGQPFSCPRCAFFVNPYAARLVSAHHLTLLRPQEEIVSELFPVRFQILRLYPEFASHPVFNDLGSLQKGCQPL
jgi:hypothetical protein